MLQIYDIFVIGGYITTTTDYKNDLSIYHDIFILEFQFFDFLHIKY